jgi:hypothetical protein
LSFFTILIIALDVGKKITLSKPIILGLLSWVKNRNVLWLNKLLKELNWQLWKRHLAWKRKSFSNNGLFIIESETKKSTVFQNKLTESEIILLKMRKWVPNDEEITWTKITTKKGEKCGCEKTSEIFFLCLVFWKCGLLV